MNIRQAFDLIYKALGVAVVLNDKKLSELTDIAVVAIKRVRDEDSALLTQLKEEQERSASTIAKLTLQRNLAEGRAKAAEEDLALRQRIGERERKALTETRDEATRLRKELGWIPSAFDSFRRGIGRIAPELSHMAQLAIMELERQADDWLNPTEDDS